MPVCKANLINAGILPLTFKNEADYDRIDKDDMLSLPFIKDEILGDKEITLKNITKNETYTLMGGFSRKAEGYSFGGGLLNYTSGV